MTTALAVAAPAVTGDEMDLIRRTVANGASDPELKLFLFDCQRRGVHPLDKLIHFTKRGGRYTPVTSIDFMRSQAAMTGEMAGSEDPIFLTDEAKPHPIAATVTVYRMTQGQRFPYTATARWSEYCPDNAPMWKRMPHTMLGKCAEALALRKAFPQQLAGLYTTDEMDQAGRPDPQAPPSRPALVAASPEPSGIRPSVPNGGDSGALQATRDGDVIDAITGEERPAPPAGFYYVSGYSFGNGWHEARLLNYDAQGGSLKVSTKRDFGYLLQQAETDGAPVKVETTPKRNAVGEAYLAKISVYKPASPEPAVMVDASSIPF